ncbi:MAG TPA: MFS transporter [Candidatus Udaeobacter sp.]|nr:MFS transporter [Candidatus Udaeobacter sp.]
MTATPDDDKATIKKTMLWVLGILFVAANLRAPITSIGPLLSLIKSSTGMNSALAGMITTLPLIAFAAVSPLIPRIAGRIGIEAALMYALLLLSAGIFMRSLPSVFFLIAGTALMGIGITAGNVLLPSMIKKKQPQKAGILTGAYIASMNLSSAVGFGISLPLAEQAGLGWRGSLLCWSVLSVTTIVIWLPQICVKGLARTERQNQSARFPVELWKSAEAWNITIYMGLQSLPFYLLSAWLGDMLSQQGVEPAQSGWMLSIIQFTSLPATFFIPIIAQRLLSQSGIGAAAGGFVFAGTAGLAFGPVSFLPVWMVLIGLGTGTAISFVLLLFGLRTRNAQEAAELSGMAQSFGYLLAAAGPILFGWIYDLTNSWTIPRLLLMLISVLLLLSGAWAGRKGYLLKDSDNSGSASDVYMKWKEPTLKIPK